jgi:NAD(P)H dehydrogenase (quinone)
VIRGPAGDGRCAVVAKEDVARAAVAVLADPSAHAGATYDLTGPEALSLTDVARIISEVRGREVRFHDETIEEAYASRAVYGAPDWEVDAWVSTYTAIASGGMAAVSDAVERLTGRPPLSAHFRAADDTAKAGDARWQVTMPMRDAGREP